MSKRINVSLRKRALASIMCATVVAGGASAYAMAGGINAGDTIELSAASEAEDGIVVSDDADEQQADEAAKAQGRKGDRGQAEVNYEDQAKGKAISEANRQIEAAKAAKKAAEDEADYQKNEEIKDVVRERRGHAKAKMAGESFKRGLATPHRCESDCLYWRIEDGTLYIDGSGRMLNRTDNGTDNISPWGEYVDMVTKVVLGESVMDIGSNAFAHMKKLESVELGNRIDEIGANAFADCPNLNNVGYGNNMAESVVLGEHVTGVGENAFQGCKQIKDVYIHAKDLEGYRFDSFENDPGLCAKLENESLMSLLSFSLPYDFAGPARTTMHVLDALDNATSKESCISLYRWKAAGGKVLNDVVGSEGSDAVRDAARDQAANSVEKAEACSEASRAKDARRRDVLNILDKTSTTLNEYGKNRGSEEEHNENIDRSRRIASKVAKDAELEKATDRWLSCEGDNLQWKVDGNKLLIKGDGAMRDYDATKKDGQAPWFTSGDRIEEVVIEKGVTSIGNCAFYGMPNLKSVEITDDVTTIGEDAFRCCGELERFGYGDTEAGTAMFHGGVTKLGAGAFTGCIKLKNVYFMAEDLSNYRVEGFTDKTVKEITNIVKEDANPWHSVLEFFGMPSTANTLANTLNDHSNEFAFGVADNAVIHVHHSIDTNFKLDGNVSLYFWKELGGNKERIVADIVPGEEITAIKDAAAKKAQEEGPAMVAAEKRTAKSKADSSKKAAEVAAKRGVEAISKRMAEAHEKTVAARIASGKKAADTEIARGMGIISYAINEAQKAMAQGATSDKAEGLSSKLNGKETTKRTREQIEKNW